MVNLTSEIFCSTKRVHFKQTHSVSCALNYVIYVNIFTKLLSKLSKTKYPTIKSIIVLRLIGNSVIQTTNIKKKNSHGAIPITLLGISAIVVQSFIGIGLKLFHAWFNNKKTPTFFVINGRYRKEGNK